MEGRELMKFTQKEVLQFVEENDVKFVRLAFYDVLGLLKNISVQARELQLAFKKGFPVSAKAVEGRVCRNDRELLLFPDPATMTILPWRPQDGCVARLFCDIKNTDGSDYACDTRAFYQRSVARCNDLGLECKIGFNCEFYLFRNDEYGDPTFTPHDEAGYLDVAPLDRGENVRRDIHFTLEQMSIIPQSSHHEAGPGQNEIDFKRSDAFAAADRFATFKSVVKAIAARNGVYASFMPKPLADKPGSGLHMKVSALKNEKGFFGAGGKVTPEGERFRAGIIARLPEITLFTSPLVNSYERLCGEVNASDIVKTPFSRSDDTKFSINSPDPSCNHYLAGGLIIAAGLSGLEDGFMPDSKPLPSTLKEAITAAQDSEFVKNTLPPEITDLYCRLKTEEWELCNSGKSAKDELFRREFLFI